MTIDTSGKWWKGQNFGDLAEYIVTLTKEARPATKVLPCICACGHHYFTLSADQDEGCAKRTCTKCGAEVLIADSQDIWKDASPRSVKCPCGNKSFELCVGFSFRQTGDVDWIYVGQRCEKCGVLASYVDWKIDYSPTEHLLKQI